MKKSFLLITFFLSIDAIAATEEQFQRCVQIKDATIAVAAQADKGVTRQELKSRLSSRELDGLIDWVYDFRGAVSNQELAQKQMELCLQRFGSASKKRR